jgi:DNA polymerase I-like protein with 3'-5' exonuclease and polymerase domains
VHDEIVVECRAEDADTVRTRLETVMCTPPAWCPDLPLGVEAQVMTRYGK